MKSTKTICELLLSVLQCAKRTKVKGTTPVKTDFCSVDGHYKWFLIKNKVTRSTFLLFTLSLCLFFFFAQQAFAFSLAPYMEGTGKYNCFPPKIFDCGPKPPKLQGYGITVVHVLDQNTRKINNKSAEQKAILILSPLLAGSPLTVSLAKKAWAEGVADIVESTIVALIRSSPNLRVDDKSVNEKFVRDLFKFGSASKQMKGTLVNLTKMDHQNFKDAHDFYKALRSIEEKWEAVKKAYYEMDKALEKANPHAAAKEQLQRAKVSMDRCEFKTAENLLDQAYAKMKLSCQRDGYRYRKIENYKDCFYGEWWTDRMKPGYPKYDEFQKLHNDSVRVQEGIIHRLKLFPEIDRAKQELKKSENYWVKAAQRINFHVRNAQQAFNYGQWQRACQAVRNVIDSEYQLSKGLPSCARKLKNVGLKLRDRLHKKIEEEQKKIVSDLRRADNEIGACRLDQAERIIDPLQGRVNQLVILDGNNCRPTMASHKLMREIQHFYRAIAEAKSTRCRKRDRVNLGDLQGEWKWFNGDKVLITRSGAVSLTRRWIRGSITVTPNKSKPFTITWFDKGKKTFIDYLRLSPDKSTLSGTNNVGGSVSARRIGSVSQGSGTGGSGGKVNDPIKKGRSCEECVRQYCPQCRDLLFCKSNDVSCSSCIRANQGKISACQQGQ